MYRLNIRPRDWRSFVAQFYVTSFISLRSLIARVWDILLKSANQLKWSARLRIKLDRCVKFNRNFQTARLKSGLAIVNLECWPPDISFKSQRINTFLIFCPPSIKDECGPAVSEILSRSHPNFWVKMRNCTWNGPSIRAATPSDSIKGVIALKLHVNCQPLPLLRDHPLFRVPHKRDATYVDNHVDRKIFAPEKLRTKRDLLILHVWHISAWNMCKFCRDNPGCVSRDARGMIRSGTANIPYLKF